MRSEKQDESATIKLLIVRIIGFVLLIGGIILVIIGGINLYRGWTMDPFTNGDINPEKSKATIIGIRILVGGGFMIIPSLFILGVSAQLGIFHRMDSKKYYHTIGQDDDYERYDRIIQENSKARASKSNRTAKITPREGVNGEPIVKIRCQLCGALNDEDAKFCDQCSQPL